MEKLKNDRKKCTINRFIKNIKKQSFLFTEGYIEIYVCYGIRNISFSENFTYVPKGWSQIIVAIAIILHQK